MPAPSRLIKYPPEYSQLLLHIPLDGSPVELDYITEAEAHRERLAFYNFLRFLARNEVVAREFNGVNRWISIAQRGSRLTFTCRKPSAQTNVMGKWLSAQGVEPSRQAAMKDFVNEAPLNNAGNVPIVGLAEGEIPDFLNDPEAFK